MEVNSNVNIGPLVPQKQLRFEFGFYQSDQFLSSVPHLNDAYKESQKIANEAKFIQNKLLQVTKGRQWIMSKLLTVTKHSLLKLQVLSDQKEDPATRLLALNIF